ncbi:hypothetical protein GX48_00592 [Paracoccidioides brasiliensis]|nr:hypothetical protein GX48_00592 [Paracoccidioides brasiliensis]
MRGGFCGIRSNRLDKHISLCTNMFSAIPIEKQLEEAQPDKAQLQKKEGKQIRKLKNHQVYGLSSAPKDLHSAIGAGSCRSARITHDVGCIRLKKQKSSASNWEDSDSPVSIAAAGCVLCTSHHGQSNCISNPFFGPLQSRAARERYTFDSSVLLAPVSNDCTSSTTAGLHQATDKAPPLTPECWLLRFQVVASWKPAPGTSK